MCKIYVDAENTTKQIANSVLYSLLSKAINKNTKGSTMLSEYVEMAESFLSKHNATMEIEEVDVRNSHFVYEVTIERDDKAFMFEYNGSVYDYMHNEEANVYDVLAYLQKYEVGTIDDFIHDYDYGTDKHSISEIMSTYEAVKNEYKNVYNLFSDCMNELREIY